MDAISRLCSWYERQAINDWHEDHGVRIATLDNPGWSLKVDLEGTFLQGRAFQDVQIDRSDDDWVRVRRNGDVFEAFGGPSNLNEMIESFLSWAEGVNARDSH